MPKWRDRECETCGDIIFTASKSNVCLTCNVKQKTNDYVSREKEIIEDYGYEIVTEPTKNNFGKRVYKLKTECCGGEFETTYGNLITGIKKNEKSGYNKLPCGICGPTNRMANALAKYEEKHGKDYDVDKFRDYNQLVRKLSNINYRLHKTLINPNSYIRGLNHDYHLDHKTPIMECFKMGWAPEKASAVVNLQMLPFRENLSKGSS